jgi:hypothetical protein
VLNPDTSSDSDSLKSKGARWVSARVQITHKGKRGTNSSEEVLKELRIEKESNRIVVKTIKVLKTAS